MMRLFQKDSNSIFYTDEPIFDCLTNKQIEMGYQIAINKNKPIGIFSWGSFRKEILYQFFENEFVWLRVIKSNAMPTKKSKKRERGKLTNALRYRILKRDNFKCQSCGAKAGDVELEVDHIIPISKGGKTNFENLQVLCKSCNRGKSNKL